MNSENTIPHGPGGTPRPAAAIASVNDNIAVVSKNDAEKTIRRVGKLALRVVSEEQPLLMAGNVVIERDRVTALLDAPYSGFSAPTIRRVASTMDAMMTIENLTTFHSEAKRRHEEQVLLIYTAGMPSPSWRAMYARILQDLPATVPVYHWGDIDEGGFRIAATLAKDALTAGHTLIPHSMSPEDVPLAMQREASERTLERIRYFATAAGWPELGDAITEAGFTVEQEGLA